jgi:hypothetical protein
MLIPKHYRRQLRSIGYYNWFWYRIQDWFYGERYKFIDGKVIYIFDGDIITIRKGTDILWRSEEWQK